MGALYSNNQIQNSPFKCDVDEYFNLIAQQIQKLTNEKSVHLSTYPKCDEKLINPVLEEKMDLVRQLISIGRFVREENKIKVRQPLSEVLIDGKNEKILSDLVNLIKEELNVKNVVFVNDINTYMNFKVLPNLKSYWKKYEIISRSIIKFIFKRN